MKLFAALKRVAWGYLLFAILLCTLGILSLCFHGMLDVLAIVVGVLVALFAVVGIVLTLAERERGVRFFLRLTMMILILCAGVVCACLRAESVPVFANVFALLILSDGVIRLYGAALSRRFSRFGWWLLIVFGVGALVGGFLMIKFTPAGDKLAVLLGLLFLFDGIGDLFYLFRPRIVLEAPKKG